ncbi:MAG: GntG family PLP-dependent aldolase [Dehalococcoidia bacterium]
MDAQTKSIIDPRLATEPHFFGKPRLEFRWEALSPPTEEMWEAMRRASQSLGMASRGEDPIVQELTDYVADLTGHERALLLPTTTICTTLGWQALDLRGTQAIMEARCHHYWVEHLHVCATSGAAPVLIMGDKFGAMPLDQVEEAITRSYYAMVVPTGLIALENTHNVCGGTCLTPEYTDDVAQLGQLHGVPVFLDGARIFNAAVALRVPVRRLTAQVDVLSLSLGKGVGAPFGAVLCGSAELLERAEILARRTGTLALHRAGIVAAAALAGLQTMESRLQEDHRKARALADKLSGIAGLAIDLDVVQTNFVRVNTTPSGLTAYELSQRFSQHGLAVHVVEPLVFKMIPNWSTTYGEIDEAASVIAEALRDVPSS